MPILPLVSGGRTGTVSGVVGTGVVGTTVGIVGAAAGLSSPVTQPRVCHATEIAMSVQPTMRMIASGLGRRPGAVSIGAESSPDRRADDHGGGEVALPLAGPALLAALADPLQRVGALAVGEAGQVDVLAVEADRLVEVALALRARGEAERDAEADDRRHVAARVQLLVLGLGAREVARVEQLVGALLLLAQLLDRDLVVRRAVARDRVERRPGLGADLAVDLRARGRSGTA